MRRSSGVVSRSLVTSLQELFDCICPELCGSLDAIEDASRRCARFAARRVGFTLIALSTP
jgi:hypothetical protein